jgi:hypothetical protein
VVSSVPKYVLLSNRFAIAELDKHEAKKHRVRRVTRLPVGPIGHCVLASAIKAEWDGIDEVDREK